MGWELAGLFGVLMLIFESTETNGSLGVETRAYLDEEDRRAGLTLSQTLYRGEKVVSHSSIEMEPVDYAKIVTILSQIEIEKFLKNYKAK